MVQDVERFDPERHVLPVVDNVEVLAYPEIQVPIPRTPQDTDTGIAKLSLGRVLEAVDVDPRIVYAGATDRAVTHAVRPFERAGRLQRLPRTVVDRDWQSTVRLEDAVHRPAIQGDVLRARRITAVHLAEGQLVDGRQAEVVAHVVGRRSVVLLRVRAIQIVIPLARRLTPANTVIPDVVAERLAVGVRGEEFQPLGWWLAQARLQSVVSADPDRVGAARDPDVRVQWVERAALIQRPPGVDRARIGFRLVEVERDDHVARAAPHITNLTGERVGQLALDHEIPLLRELGPQVRSEDAKQRAGTAVHVGDDVREAGSCSAGPGRGVEDAPAFEIERGILSEPEILPGAFHVLHDAEGAAHDPLGGRRPGDADTRLEATVERIVERAAVAVLAGQEQLPRREVYIRLPIVLLDPWRGVLPRQAEIQREVVADAEVVLTENGDAVSELQEGGDQAAPTLRGYLIQEEVREAEAGERARVLEVAKDSLVARIGESLPLVEPTAAELELMTTLEPGVLVSELEGLDVVEFRPASVSETDVAADIEG